MQVYDQIAWNMLVLIHMDSKDDAHGAWVDMLEDWTNRQLGGPPDPGADPKGPKNTWLLGSFLVCLYRARLLYGTYFDDKMKSKYFTVRRMGCHSFSFLREAACPYKRD
jgi:hypothetical protein